MLRVSAPPTRRPSRRPTPFKDEGIPAEASFVREQGVPRTWVGLAEELATRWWLRESWDRLSVLRLCVVFLAASVSSWLGIALSRQSGGVTTIWLSNGLLLGLLITQPPRRWVGYFAAGLAADTVADLVWGDPFHLAIGVSLANSIEVIASSVLLTMLFGWPLDLARRKTLVGFLLVSVVAATAATSAVGATWTLYWLPGGTWTGMFRTWYLGDMLGMAVLAPLLIVVQRPAFFSMLGPRQLAKTLAVLACSVVTALLVFTHQSDPLIFLMFPALLLVAFRLGFPGTVVNILLVTLIAIECTVHGLGPLMLIAGEHMTLHRIIVAQLFAATAIFTMFPVAALLEEKKELKESLKGSEGRFRDLAHRDELTGFWNRRAFNLQLEAAWEEAARAGESLALLLLDADYFKQYNDHFGHLGGDECLRGLADAIAQVAERCEAWAARFGGEEFAVLLAGVTLTEAVEVGEQIRRCAMDLGLEHPTNPTGLQTVSIGAAATMPSAGRSATALVMQADKALYRAKMAGRNRVACE